jgi:hypothetical protein
MKRLAILIGFVLLAVIAGCGDEETTPRNSPTITASATPKEIEVIWDDAVRLLQDCRVRQVSQAHSLEVWLFLDDGTKAVTVEPEIDLVIHLGFDAQEKCGGQPKQIVTE